MLDFLTRYRSAKMADLAASTSGFPVDFTGCGTASMVLNELVLTIFNPVGSTLATGAEVIAVVSRQRIGRGLRNCRSRTRTGTRLSSPPALAGPGGSAEPPPGWRCTEVTGGGRRYHTLETAVRH